MLRESKHLSFIDPFKLFWRFISARFFTFVQNDTLIVQRKYATQPALINTNCVLFALHESGVVGGWFLVLGGFAKSI